MATENLRADYENFMKEIFNRLDAIDESLAEIKSAPDHLQNWRNCDFSWIAMRKICEYLVLAILLVHYRDDEAHVDIHKWRPRDIMGDIARINDFPAPIPIKIEIHAGGPHSAIPMYRALSSNVITSIYGKCSELIHVGSLERILCQNLPSFEIAQMQKWVRGLRSFLTNHILLLPKIKHVVICRGSNAPSNGPEIYLAEAESEACFDTSNLGEFDWETA